MHYVSKNPLHERKPPCLVRCVTINVREVFRATAIQRPRQGKGWPLTLLHRLLQRVCIPDMGAGAASLLPGQILIVYSNIFAGIKPRR